MLVSVMHLIDRETPEDALRLLGLLVRLGPVYRLTHRIVSMGPVAGRLELPARAGVERIAVRFDWPMLSLPALRSLVRRVPPDVLHALGSRAAGVAGGLRKVGVSLPVVATLTDPADADRAGRWWRSLEDVEGGVEVLCASSMVQRRLVERGIPQRATAVVRPGVDFAELKTARDGFARLRDDVLGVFDGFSEAAHETMRSVLNADSMAAHGRAATAGGRSSSSPGAAGPAGQAGTTGGCYGNRRGPLLVMPSPPTRAGGQFLGVWAVAILRQIWPDVRLVIPGCSREADRIGRLVQQIYCPDAFAMTGDRFSPAELLSISDALIVPAVDDIPTGWLAWAMAAGVPIIGSAIHTVTEFIADRHNGFLCRPGEPHTLAIRIRTAFESPDQMRQCAEVARGQAYDVFRAQQCIDQYTSAFTTLAGGRPAVSAVRDAAVAT